MTGPRKPVSLAMTPSALGSARTKSDDELERTATTATAAIESDEEKRVILAERSGFGAVCGGGEGKRRKSEGGERKGEMKELMKPKRACLFKKLCCVARALSQSLSLVCASRDRIQGRGGGLRGQRW